VAQDAGEQIVEVVGDPACQLGDLARPVELGQPVLQGAAVGHIGGAAGIAEELASRALHRIAETEQPSVLAVLVQHPELDAERAPGRDRGRVLRLERLAVFRVQGLGPAPAQHGGHLAAGELRPAPIQVVARAVRARGPEQSGEQVEGEARIRHGHADQPADAGGERANVAARCSQGKGGRRALRWRWKPLRHTLFGCLSWTPSGSARRG
jgi:hypothetical protein